MPPHIASETVKETLARLRAEMREHVDETCRMLEEQTARVTQLEILESPPDLERHVAASEDR